MKVIINKKVKYYNINLLLKKTKIIKKMCKLLCYVFIMKCKLSKTKFLTNFKVIFGILMWIAIKKIYFKDYKKLLIN